MSAKKHPQTDPDGTLRDEAAKRAASRSAEENSRGDAEQEAIRSARSKHSEEGRSGRKDHH